MRDHKARDGLDHPMSRRLRAGVLGAAMIIASVGGMSAQLGRIQIDVDPVIASDGVHAGTVVHAALQVQLQDGYHVNSNTPLDDFLIPTVLTVEPPEDITVREIVYPEAGLLEQAGADGPLAVFEESFVIGISFDVADAFPPGVVTIPATLRYQACDETMCYLPTSADVVWALHVVPSDQMIIPARVDIFDEIAFTGTRSVGAAAASVAATALAPAAEGADLAALLDDFKVLGTTGGYLNSKDFLSFMGAAESGEVQRGWFEGRGPLAILILILIGGLALNLTPCVLPMIPINLAIIGAGARSGSRVRGFALGGAYGLAMALVYGVLGLIVILTAGTFGTINASAGFNLGIAALFVVLGLAMFDVLVIDFSRFQSKLNIGSNDKGSFLVAFGMGSVAALLAGACVAPVVIQVILFSSDLYATGTTLALSLPFFLGFGMALPWPIAGAGLSFMPKPGAWTVRVKQAFGVFILATAAYYGYVGYGIISNRWVDGDEVASSVQEKLREGWYASLSQGLATARAENKLVLVDVWATWCKNCLTMDKTTLTDPDVTTGLDSYIKIKFQAEDPSASPAKEIMQRFDSIGLPTYAILRPTAGSDVARSSTLTR